jgi:type II secretory pathway pseudopilin PulG
MKRSLRTRGLTLIEILVVVGIILIITAMLGAGMRTVTDKARHKATKALIGRIQTALESYHGEFRDYPPDGYDDENIPGQTPVMTLLPQGVVVGYGNSKRAVKGTASLIYFLCRPVTRISFLGDASDARNQVKKTVGPFLTVEPSILSRPEATIGTDVVPFDASFPWIGSRGVAFWGDINGTGNGTGRMIKCEIIDPFGRPLCYDKVKTYSSTTDLKYFQPHRFHYFGSTTLSPPHPDNEFLASMSTSDDEELLNTPDWPDDTAPIAANASTTRHSDPRFLKTFNPANSRYQTGTVGSHGPRNVGAYDLWAPGRSWTNARDDITSWD